MEKEKIITLTEILDYSEDEEPPSGGEGKISTFAFACVDNVLRLPTLKFSLLGSLSIFRRKSFLKVSFLWTKSHYRAMDIAMTIIQINAFWQAFGLIFPNFHVSLYNSLSHFRRVIEYCLVKEFDAIMWRKAFEQNYPEYKSITSYQISRVQLITIKNKWIC